jgi:hypothetical protein
MTFLGLARIRMINSLRYCAQASMCQDALTRLAPFPAEVAEAIVQVIEQSLIKLPEHNAGGTVRQNF